MVCICLWDEFYLWTRELVSPNTPTLMPPHTLVLVPFLNTQCYGNWRDNINPASVTCSVTYFPILTSRRNSECYLCASLSYEHTHTHCLGHYQKGTPCASVPPGFCFLHGLRWRWGFPFSGTHVERWYVWMLNRTPQRIPNWEHGVVGVVGGSFIFTFLSA